MGLSGQLTVESGQLWYPFGMEKMRLLNLRESAGNWCLKGCVANYRSLRTSPLSWCGNPPVERNQVTITDKNRSNSHSSGNFSVHFPSNRGIATPVCALARNDSAIYVRILATVSADGEGQIHCLAFGIERIKENGQEKARLIYITFQILSSFQSLSLFL